MKNKLILYLSLIIATLLCFSCQKESHRIEKHYYSSGELLSEIPIRIKDSLKDGVYKEYHKNGNLRIIGHLENGEIVDSSMVFYETGELKLIEKIKGDTVCGKYFHKNGKVSSTSKSLNLDPPILIGWTTLFNKKGDLTGKLEYIKINGKEYLNQFLYYNKNEEFVSDSSNYYKFKVSKLKNSHKYRFEINYYPANKDADVLIVIGKYFNNDFSNLSEVKSDTLYLENNELFTSNLKEPYRKIKGFFYEYYAKLKDTVNRDSVRMSIYEKKIYFNTVVSVTDTIE